MIYVAAALAFIPSITVWFAASTLLASGIFQAEGRTPDMVRRPAWKALEIIGVLVIFVGSVALWIGLSFWLQILLKS